MAGCGTAVSGERGAVALIGGAGGARGDEGVWEADEKEAEASGGTEAGVAVVDEWNDALPGELAARASDAVLKLAECIAARVGDACLTVTIAEPAEARRSGKGRSENDRLLSLDTLAMLVAPMLPLPPPTPVP
jgi:hypothetical protein